jgi:hypothetical protein
MAKDTIDEAFMPTDECSICGSEYDEEAGGVQGHFGICPVTFCVWCYSSIIDMASQHLGLTEEDG